MTQEDITTQDIGGDQVAMVTIDAGGEQLAIQLAFLGFDFDRISFDTSIPTQDSKPTGITLSDDGSLMHELGQNNGNFYQYELSTDYDITSATHTDTIDTWNGQPRGMAWSDDGTFFVEVDMNDDTVYGYNASTPFDVTTLSRPIGTTHGNNNNTATFNSDGTKLYTIKDKSSPFNYLFEHEVGTAWDVTTAERAVGFGVDPSAGGMAWNDDGTKVYVAHESGASADVHQHAVSTAYDIRTASSTSEETLSMPEELVDDVVFNNDGTKLYVCSRDNSHIQEYHLSTAYDIGTGSLATTISSQDSSPKGLEWNDDGTKLYECGGGSNDIHEYDVSTAFDISTASLSSTVNSQGSPNGIQWNSDGTKFYEINPSSDGLHEYSASTAYDITSLTLEQTVDTIAGTPDGRVPNDLLWKDDGTTFWELADVIIQYDAGTAFDVTTIDTPVVHASRNDPRDITWNDDGTKFYELAKVSGNPPTGYLNEYTASGAYSFKGASHNTEITLDNNNLPAAMTWNDDGTKFFLCDNYDNQIEEYDLSTAYDITTASLSTSIASEGNKPKGIAFNSDGTKMYEADKNNNNVHEYDLSTAYDITTASVSHTLDVGNQSPNGMGIGDSGKKLYVVPQDIYQWTVETAYDITTAHFPEQDNINNFQPRGVTFNDDGTRIYVIGTNGNKTTQFDLDPAYALSTASQAGTKTNKGGGTTRDCMWNDDGTKFYELDHGNDVLYQFSASTPFDVTTTTFEESLDMQDDLSTGAFWGASGTRLYEIGNDQDKIYEYN